MNILKNWRPITLLNYDYKISSKCIANRIQKVLPKLINNDQTAFLNRGYYMAAWEYEFYLLVLKVSVYYINIDEMSRFKTTCFIHFRND